MHETVSLTGLNIHKNNIYNVPAYKIHNTGSVPWLEKYMTYLFMHVTFKLYSFDITFSFYNGGICNIVLNQIK